MAGNFTLLYNLTAFFPEGWDQGRFDKVAFWAFVKNAHLATRGSDPLKAGLTPTLCDNIWKASGLGIIST